MLKLRRVTKVKVFFLVLVYVFNFDLFEFPAAILEKGLYCKADWTAKNDKFNAQYFGQTERSLPYEHKLVIKVY